MSDDLVLPGFSSAFDAAMAASGPPAMFTINHRGELRLDGDRTREGWGRLGREPRREVAHVLLRDRATGWVQYALLTSPELMADHPRAEVRRFESQEAALGLLATLGELPVWHASIEALQPS